MQVDRSKLKSGRAVCPRCGRRGLGFAPHPHAFGWKDYGRARCRYCYARFKLAAPSSAWLKADER